MFKRRNRGFKALWILNLILAWPINSISAFFTFDNDLQREREKIKNNRIFGYLYL